MLSPSTRTTESRGTAATSDEAIARGHASPWMDAEHGERMRAFDLQLRAIAHAHPILAGCTARNDAEEFARVEERWRAGEATSPKWIAPTVDHAQLADARRRIASARVRLARERSIERVIGEAYDDRFEELSRELEVIAAAFGPRIAQAARGRFDVGSVAWLDRQRDADALARAWLRAPARPDRAPLHRTDDADDPCSLLSQVRLAIANAGAIVSIVVRARVGSLAATGDGVVVVAADRTTTADEARRVALHEVEGHVLPRLRGRRFAVGLASIGSARASEDEEGRALALEEEAGILDASRRRVLGARHLAARAVVAGASFVEVVRALVDDHGLDIEAALRVAFRVHRGACASGASVAGGLAREQVYLPALLEVRRALTEGRTTLAALGSARLSLEVRARSGLDARR